MPSSCFLDPLLLPHVGLRQIILGYSIFGFGFGFFRILLGRVQLVPLVFLLARTLGRRNESISGFSLGNRHPPLYLHIPHIFERSWTSLLGGWRKRKEGRREWRAKKGQTWRQVDGELGLVWFGLVCCAVAPLLCWSPSTCVSHRAPFTQSFLLREWRLGEWSGPSFCVLLLSLSFLCERERERDD